MMYQVELVSGEIFETDADVIHVGPSGELVITIVVELGDHKVLCYATGHWLSYCTI